VRALVRGFEEVLLRTLGRFGIRGRRDAGRPGVWVGEAKIGSIGIAVRHGISFHGFSLNAAMDLTPFAWIHTCGHKGLAVTSLSEQLGREVPVHEVKGVVASLFAQTLSYRPVLPDAAQGRAAADLGLPSPETRRADGPENVLGWILPDKHAERGERGR